MKKIIFIMFLGFFAAGSGSVWAVPLSKDDVAKFKKERATLWDKRVCSIMVDGVALHLVKQVDENGDLISFQLVEFPTLRSDEKYENQREIYLPGQQFLPGLGGDLFTFGKVRNEGIRKDDDLILFPSSTLFNPKRGTKKADAVVFEAGKMPSKVDDACPQQKVELEIGPKIIFPGYDREIMVKRIKTKNPSQRTGSSSSPTPDGAQPAY